MHRQRRRLCTLHCKPRPHTWSSLTRVATEPRVVKVKTRGLFFVVAFVTIALHSLFPVMLTHHYVTHCQFLVSKLTTRAKSSPALKKKQTTPASKSRRHSASTTKTSKAGRHVAHRFGSALLCLDSKADCVLFLPFLLAFSSVRLHRKHAHYVTH